MITSLTCASLSFAADLLYAITGAKHENCWSSENIDFYLYHDQGNYQGKFQSCIFLHQTLEHFKQLIIN